MEENNNEGIKLPAEWPAFIVGLCGWKWPQLIIICLGGKVRDSVWKTVYELVNLILLKIYIAGMRNIMIQSGHNFAHAMTAELSWHVQNYYLIKSVESKLEQNECSQIFSDQSTNTL